MTDTRRTQPASPLADLPETRVDPDELADLWAKANRIAIEGPSDCFDELIYLWAKASLIAIEGPLHPFVPKEPGWCQVLGNKVDSIVRKQMSIRPWDEGRTVAALQKHVKRLNYVYDIATARRQAHLAERRLKRQQAKVVGGKPALTVGGRHGINDSSKLVLGPNSAKPLQP